MESIDSYPNNRQENWVAYRESAEFKNGVRMLENCPVIDFKEKALILAVALNLKKAAVINVFKDQATQREIDKMFSELGVYFFRDKEHEKNFDKFLENMGTREGSQDMHYIVAVSPQAMAEVTVVSSYPQDYAEEFGRAMGYPETAIRAYKKYKSTGDENFLLKLNDKKLTEEEKAFSFFRFSSDNWEKEVEWLEQIIAGVKACSPQIYYEVMKGFKN